MGRASIAEKIAKELRQDTFSEPLAVYLLVEVRKLLEHSKMKKKLGTLTFYCSWVVHANLSFTQAQAIVRNADEFARDRRKMTSDVELNNMAFVKFISFGELRQELDYCLNMHEVDKLSDTQWIRFLAALALVIEECPLTCKGTGALQYVDEVVLKAGDIGSRLGNPEGKAVGIHWELLKEGIVRLGATTVVWPNGREALVGISELVQQSGFPPPASS